MKKHFLYLVLVLLLSAMGAQANDYMEHTENYTVYASGIDKIHFSIPVWVHGAWYERSYSALPGSHFTYKEGSNDEVTVLNWLAHVMRDNDRDNDKGTLAVKFQPDQGQLYLTCMHNGVRMSVSPDGNWTDWLTVKQKPAGGYDRVTFLEFDWYPPQSLDGKDFKIKIYSEFDNFDEILDEYAYSFCDMDITSDYSKIECYNEVNPDYKKSWELDNTFKGKDQLVAPTLFDPYLYQMSEEGMAGYGYAAIPYSLVSPPISYRLSVDGSVHSVNEQAGNIFVMTNDTLLKDVCAKFIVWRDSANNTKDSIMSTKVDLKPYHRIHDFVAKEELDSTDSYTGANVLSWTIKNPLLEDLVEGDYFEIVRATDTAFTDAASLAVIPLVVDSAGEYTYRDDDRSISTGHLDGDSITLPLVYADDDYFRLKNDKGTTMFLLKPYIQTDKSVVPSLPVYYRIRRASSAVWGWHEDFSEQRTVYKHNFLAPLATTQPQYEKDADFDNNHKVNFRVILSNEEVPTILPSEGLFKFDYTVANSTWDSVRLATDFDASQHSTYPNMVRITIKNRNDSVLVDNQEADSPTSFLIPKGSSVDVQYLFHIPTDMSSADDTVRYTASFVVNDHGMLHFDAPGGTDIYIRSVQLQAYDAPEGNPETYLTDALKQQIKDTLYTHLKAQYESNPFGRCVWDKTANLVLIRTMEETGTSTEIIIPADSIRRDTVPDEKGNLNWIATFSDYADKGCTHYSYAVRIDQSNADLHVRNPQIQLQPKPITGPNLYFDESAKIVSFTATQGDARSELKQGVLLNWKPSSSAVDEYIVCRIVKGSSDAPDTVYTGIETTYMDLTAVPDVHYEYTVSSYYSCNGKTSSNSATAEGWRTPYGEISGSILMPDNSGMAGVKVDLMDLDDSTVVRSMTTDGTGAYTFDSLKYYYAFQPKVHVSFQHDGQSPDPSTCTQVRIKENGGAVQDWAPLTGDLEVAVGDTIEVKGTCDELYNKGVASTFTISRNGTLTCKTEYVTVSELHQEPKIFFTFTDDGKDHPSQVTTRQFSVIPTSEYGVFSYNYTAAPTATVELAIDNALANGIDFMNTNTTRLTGRALYENTTIPVAGAMFKLNGDTVRRGGAPLTTGTDGNFELTLTKNQPYTLQIFKPGHTFAQDGYFQKEEGKDTFDIDKPLDGIRFYDQTRVRLVGRVAGGIDQRDLPEAFGLGKNNLGQDLQLVFQLEGDNVAHFVYDPNDLTRDTMLQIVDHLVYTGDSLAPTRSVGKTRALFEKKRIIVQPDPKTGEYEVDLCPVKYKVTQATAKGYATLFNDGTGNETFDLTNAPLTLITDTLNGDTVHYNATYDRIYRTPVRVELKQNLYGMERVGYGEPEMEVNGANPNKMDKLTLYTVNDDNSVTYTFGYPVFYDSRSYQFKAKAYEAYYYNNDASNTADIVPQRGGNVIIRNGMHSATEVERYPLNEKGENNTIWLTVDDVDVEHAGTAPLRSVSIALEEEGNVVETNVFSGFITGSVVEANSLRTTRGDIQLLDVIRDPGGAGSSAYVENGAEYTFSFAYTIKANYGIKLSPTWGTNLEQYIGVYAGSPVGGSYIGELVNTQKAISIDIPISHRIDYGYSYTYKMTTNNRIETSSASDPTGVGSPADVFFGTEVANVIGKTKTISIIDDSLYQMCQPSFNAGTMLLLAQGTDSLGKPYYLVTGQKVYVSAQLSNTFTYSQYYVWNTVIPRLAMDRQDLLKNFSDAAAAQAYADATGRPTYWEFETGSYLNDTIPVTDYQMFTPNNGEAYTDEVGELNNAITHWLQILYANEKDKVIAHQSGLHVGTYSVSFGNSFSHSDSYSYEYSYNEYPQSFFGQRDLKKMGITAISSLLASAFKYGWASYKGKIGTSAINAFLQSYSKIFEQQEEGENKTNTVEAKAGNMKFHMGFGIIAESDIDKRQTTTASISKTAGYTLVADPMGDITISVAKARVDSTWYVNSYAALEQVEQEENREILYGPNVFFTEAGTTICPHEEEEKTVLYNPGTTINNATTWVAKPELTADKYEIANVSADKRASFRINLFNQGQMDAGYAENGQGFYLCLNGVSNPDGAKVYVNGAPLIQPIYYWILPSTPITQTIEVERGTVDDYNLSFSLYSEHCATTAADMNIGVHFLPVSTDVTIAAPHQNWVMNTLSPRDSTGYYLPISIDGFDIHHKNFDHIEFQYKLSSESDEKWVNQCSFFANDSLYALASGNKAMIENGLITPFRFYGERDPMEQRYDLRAVSFCRYGSGYVHKASPVISGIKDTRPPRVFGEPEPANSILGIGDHLLLRFNEPIAGNYLDEDNNFRIVGVTNETGITATTALHFDGKSTAKTKVKRDLTSKSYSIDLMIHPDESNRTADMTLLEINGKDAFRRFILTTDNRLVVQDSLTAGVTSQTSKPIGDILGYVRVIYVYNYNEGKMHFYAGTEDMTDENSYTAATAIYADYNSTFCFGRGYRGNMLETRIWTKALTEEEIAATNDHYLTGYERELLAYYRMNEGKGETIEDRAHGATLYLNGCSWSMQEGFSLAIDESSEVALAKNILDRSATYDETLMFWFKTSGNGTLFTAGRTEESEGVAAKGQRISLEKGSLVLYDGSQKWTAKGHFNDNDWHHFVLTINRTYNEADIYVDGQLYATASAARMSGIVGAMYFGGDGFAGNIDEFAVFEQALPKSMVEEYNQMAFVGDEMGLIGYLPFEEQYLNPSGVLQLRFSVNDQRQFKNPETGEIITKILPLIDGDVSAMADHTNNAPVNSHGLLTKLHFDWSFNNDELMINILNQDSEVNKQSIYITVRDVEDLNGNPMASPVTWTAFVDHNSLKWSDKLLNISTEYGLDDMTESVTVRIVNNSGKRHTYTIESLPAWLNVDKQSGAIDPTGEQLVTLYYDLQLAVGVYDDVIYLTDENGLSEPLQINYSVIAYPPYEDIDAALYPLNMSVCGEVKLSTPEGGQVYDTDGDDIVYAFYRNECVGMANITFNTMTGATEVYLTIHGNDDMNRREINFQLWRASTGRIFNLSTSRKIIFSHGNVCGCGDEAPVIFYTTGSETQSIELEAGWSWISTNLYLVPDSAAINEVMTAAEPWTEGDIIKGPATRQFSTYGADVGSFVGTLSGWDYAQMYMVYAQNGNIMRLSGEDIPDDMMWIKLRGDGQWNSFPCLYDQAMSITDVMSDYLSNASAGDIIKSHNSFAVFTSDSRWVGDLMSIRPGEGYLMRRMGMGTVTMHFYDQKKQAAPKKTKAEINAFTNTKAATNMTMIARVEGEGLMAYINDELVGVATAVPMDNTTDEVLYFLTIQCDEAGEVTFRTADGTPLRSEMPIRYAADNHFGSTEKPIVLTPTDSRPYKTIENNHVVIIRNNEKYDITGKKL